MRRRGDIFVACCLSGFGLCVGALILLRNRASRISRWVDRNALPDGVTL